MFGWEFPPHISGGLGTACYGITSGLLKHGVEVLFVVPKLFGGEENKVQLISASDVNIDIQKKIFNECWDKLTYLQISSTLIPYTSPDEFAKLTDVEISHAEYQSSSPFSIHYKLTGEYGRDIMKEVARYALVAASVATDYYFDVIHAHDWLTYPAGIAAKQVSGKPLIIHVHATEFDRSGEHINHEVFEIEKAGMECADHIISVSELTKQIIVDRYGINPEKISAVHNGVLSKSDNEKSQSLKKPKKYIVTFLGRITFQKGPDYFVEAANKVLTKNPDVHFVMAGSGDMMNRMIERVAELRISSHFHFTGFLNGEDVTTMYSMSDLYVMPSVSEPFGIAPLEAMKANVPVIISKQSGVAEVLHDVIKVDFWDTDALADAIYGVINYSSLSRMQKSKNDEVLLNMSWDNTAKKILIIYQSVCMN